MIEETAPDPTVADVLAFEAWPEQQQRIARSVLGVPSEDRDDELEDAYERGKSDGWETGRADGFEEARAVLDKLRDRFNAFERAVEEMRDQIDDLDKLVDG